MDLFGEAEKNVVLKVRSLTTGFVRAKIPKATQSNFIADAVAAKTTA
jgi:hypothetical protein